MRDFSDNVLKHSSCIHQNKIQGRCAYLPEGVSLFKGLVSTLGVSVVKILKNINSTSNFTEDIGLEHATISGVSEVCEPDYWHWIESVELH